jgi:CcmD family protein
MTMKRLVRAMLLLCCLLPAVALGQGAVQGGKKDGEWENVPGGMMMQPPGESIRASTLVGAAYGFIWLMVAGFVVSVWRRQQRLEQELDELRRRLPSDAGAAGPGARG